MNRWSAIVPCLLSFPLAAAAGQVEVRLVAASGGSDAAPSAVSLILEPVFAGLDAAAGVNPRRISTGVPGSVGLDLPPGSVWRASIDSAAYWSPVELITVDQEGTLPPQVASLTLFVTGELTGRLTVPRDEELPREMTARLESPPGSVPVIRRSTVSCPVEDGRFRCQLPAADLDLRLRARGYVSHYRWAEEVPARSSRDLGSLRLVRGASVVGWLAPPDRVFDYGACRVELAPNLTSEGRTAADRERRKGLVIGARINERGFFELAGVPPGSYRLTLSHPDYAPTSRTPVEVLPNAETELRGLELFPHARVSVAIQPVVDPFGLPWNVLLLKESVVPGHRDEVVRSPIGDDGWWESGGLEPGQYTLHVLDRYGSRWHGETFDLPPGVSAGPIEIALALTRVAGRVRLGEEPLRALLFFGGRHRVPSVAAKSDAEGLFQVVLPVREEWTVEIESPNPEVEHRLAGVEVPLGDEAWLELVVPDLSVEGQVVDEAGNAVAGASVRARSAGQPSSGVRSEDPEGRFVFRGLGEGVWDFMAQDLRAGSHRSSELHRVELSNEQQTPETLRLVLREGRVVTGQVVGPSGRPIVGALVVGLIEQTTQSLTNRVPQATTDVSGVFELRVPAGASGVQLTVMAPGFAVRQVRVDSRDPSPVVLSVEPVGGTLILRSEPSAANPQTINLFHDYRLFLPLLNHWANLNGIRGNAPGHRVFPAMEPGLYTACVGSRTDLSFRTGRPSDEPAVRCVDGFLSPFGQLELVVPSPAAERESDAASAGDR